MLGPDLSIRRFTHQAEKVLGLSAVDVGRSISSVKLKIAADNLEEAVLNVLRDMVPTRRQVRHANGAFYTLRLAPYRTSDNKIEGAVLTLMQKELPVGENAGDQ